MKTFVKHILFTLLFTLIVLIIVRLYSYTFMYFLSLSKFWMIVGILVGGGIVMFLGFLSSLITAILGYVKWAELIVYIITGIWFIYKIAVNVIMIRQDKIDGWVSFFYLLFLFCLLFAMRMGVKKIQEDEEE